MHTTSIATQCHQKELWPVLHYMPITLSPAMGQCPDSGVTQQLAAVATEENSTSAYRLVGVGIIPDQWAALHREDIAPDPGVGRNRVATKAHFVRKAARGCLSRDRQQAHGLLHGRAVADFYIRLESIHYHGLGLNITTIELQFPSLSSRCSLADSLLLPYHAWLRVCRAAAKDSQHHSRAY